MFVCSLLIASGMKSTEADREYANEFDQAREFYYRGVAGEKSATRDSIRLLQSLAQRSPGDGLITAYLASNWLLEASRTMLLWNRYRLTKEGLAGLDKAVEAASDNLEVRFIRAMSTRNLPAFLQRSKQCEDDLAWLAARAQSAAESGSLQKRLAAAALYYHGLVLERRGDRSSACAAWQRAYNVAPESHAGKAAAEKLRVVK